MLKKKTLLALALSAAVCMTLPLPVSAQSDTGPENTRRNKEMRESGTADQQAENPADRKITQKIRQAVVKNKTLSQNAHNVKIVTRNGMVTLKGPVKSEKEKQIVENAAAQVAGIDHVTSEIEVAPPKSKK